MYVCLLEPMLYISLSLCLPRVRVGDCNKMRADLHRQQNQIQSKKGLGSLCPWLLNLYSLLLSKILLSTFAIASTAVCLGYSGRTRLLQAAKKQPRNDQAQCNRSIKNPRFPRGKSLATFRTIMENVENIGEYRRTTGQITRNDLAE